MNSSNLNFNKYKNYHYCILRCSDYVEELYNAVNELVYDSIIQVVENDIIIYYPYEEMLDSEFYDIIESMIIDMGIKVKVFMGNVINKQNEQSLKDIYKVYNIYAKKDYSYSKMSDLVIYMLMKDKKVLNVIKKALIGKILEEEQLVKLVLALADNNLNVTKTATSVYMHRNTINNKLDYIKKETGFDIQNFNDAMAVFCLIKYCK